MRSLVLLMFISVFAFQAKAADKPVHLFILSGQSNMSRLSPKKTFLPEVTKLLPGTNIQHIKVAQGGMPIRQWLAEWAELAKAKGIKAKRPGSTKFYAPILAQTKTLLSKVGKPTSVTFFWMQGERDAKENLSAVYGDALRKLIANLRRDLKRPNLNVVIGRLSDHLMKSKEWVAVRDIQVAVARKDPHGAWVDTDLMNDLSKGKKIINDLHYSKKGYDALGKAFARQAVALIKGVKPADDGLPKDPGAK